MSLRRRGPSVIQLTSLLDLLFVIIFAFMIQARESLSETRADQKQLEAELVEAKEVIANITQHPPRDGYWKTRGYEPPRVALREGWTSDSNLLRLERTNTGIDGDVDYKATLLWTFPSGQWEESLAGVWSSETGTLVLTAKGVSSTAGDYKKNSVGCIPLRRSQGWSKCPQDLVGQSTRTGDGLRYVVWTHNPEFGSADSTRTPESLFELYWVAPLND